MLLTKTRVRNFLRFRSIQSKLIGALSIGVGFNFLIILAFYSYVGRESRMDDLKKQLDILNSGIHQTIELEKEYLLRKALNYPTLTNNLRFRRRVQIGNIYQILESLRNHPTNQEIPLSDKINIIQTKVKNIQQNFDQILLREDYDQVLKQINASEDVLKVLIVDLQADTDMHLNQLHSWVKSLLLSLFLGFIILNTVLGYFVIYKLTRPIQKLSRSIYESIQNNFDAQSQIFQTNTRDEVGGISRDVSVMLENVQQRTNELISEKEKLEQTQENIKRLSRIGQEITANLSFDTIVQAVRRNISQLMDVSVFAVGLYNERKNRLEFLKEEYNLFQRYEEWIDLRESRDLAVLSYMEQLEILSGDVQKEYPDHFSRIGLKNQPELKVQSLIYLPLVFKENTIGVLTVQSSQKNAYTQYHLSILSNLRNYLNIALDNAHIYERLNANNKKVLDSINYAQKIQEAMLPPLENIREVIPNSFFLYKPRDIVSGDFYWFAELEAHTKYKNTLLDAQGNKNNHTKSPSRRNLLAVVDCTGHGVPGALMSMIGHDLLNQIVLQYQVSEPDQILNELHEGIKSCFKQKENTDGMDLGLCVIDFEERFVEYAGAFMPLVVIQDGKMQVIRPNKKPVGVWYRENEERTYVKHRIELLPSKETYFYMYTDGFVDQLGGPKRKKFLSVNFYRLLLEIHHQPMETQKQILARALKSWRGKEAQNDDILVVGFKIGPEELL